jgi:hypothetical protein
MTRISLVWRFSKNGNSTPVEQSTSYKSAQLFYEFIEHFSMSLKTLKTFFFWMTVINFLILMISTFGVVMLTQEMKVLHSKIFHISPDKLSQIYFEYLAWYKLLWLFLNFVPYVAMRIMLANNGTAESSADPSQNAA